MVSGKAGIAREGTTHPDIAPSNSTHQKKRALSMRKEGPAQEAGTPWLYTQCSKRNVGKVKLGKMGKGLLKRRSSNMLSSVEKRSIKFKAVFYSGNSFYLHRLDRNIVHL